ncbi:MAG: extracellular solute-binding protein, partial [Planctomycetota bacterium]
MRVLFRTLSMLVLGIGLLAAESITVYSARHYGGDTDLFGAFTEATGIEVQVLEAKGSALLARIQHEGANCPADVLLTVDAGRLGAAADAGIFQPVRSERLEEHIPADWRHPLGHWFGYGKRARVVVYHPERVDPSRISTYRDLADERFRGRLVVRSSSNIYNQSLLAAMIARHGVAAAEAWAAGIVANMARPPQGNDRAQIKAVAAGEADVAIVNHYYHAKMLESDDPEQIAAAKAVAVHFPGQEDGSGAHLNISGAGLLT